MTLGNQRFLKSISTLAVLGALPLASTLVLAQETTETQTLPKHSEDTAPNITTTATTAPETSPTHTPTQTLVEEPVIEDTYEFTLTKGNDLSVMSPDESPDEAIAPLFKASEKRQKEQAGFDQLITTIPLRRTKPQKVMFLRSIEGGKYDTLIIDRNLDNSFSDETPILIDAEELEEFETETQSRDGQHMAEFRVNLLSDHISADNIPNKGDYPTVLRIKWTDENPIPKKLTWFGYYFYQTEIKVADKTYQILLQDVNNDGIIGTLDRWGLKDKANELPDNSSRNVLDYNWINGQAWKIDIKNPVGNRALISQFTPKTGYQQDTETRDEWSAEKIPVRADRKDRLDVLTDLDAAVKKASKENKHLIIKFESTWCEPCSAINIFVLPQQRVVDASKKYVWAKVNYEDQPELAAQYNVTTYPTMIIFKPDGKEATRFNTTSGELLVKNLNEALTIVAPKIVIPEEEPESEPADDPTAPSDSN